jgi:hypothetical protein
MARRGDSPTGAGRAAGAALGALNDLTRRRAGVDHPGLYPNADNPWTDQLARRLRVLAGEELARTPDPDRRHVIAARWRAAALLEDSPVEAARTPVYDIAWRIYAADCARMTAQPLIAECAWKGGWAALAPACDRLAQGRAGLKLLCAMADPGTEVGEMTLAQACAFRISAFAPAGDRVLLAFYGGANGWRGEPGFTVFAYTTGERGLKPAG